MPKNKRTKQSTGVNWLAYLEPNEIRWQKQSEFVPLHFL